MVAAAGPSALATAQDTTAEQRRLEEVERNLAEERARQSEAARRAEALAHEVAALRSDLIQSARQIQDKEATLNALEDALALSEAEALAKRAALSARQVQVAELAQALIRLARVPPEAILALPFPPKDVVRSSLLLQAALPSVSAEAHALSVDLQTLARVQDDIGRQKRRVQDAVRVLEVERDRLEQLTRRKAVLLRRAESESQRLSDRARELAGSARDLKDLIDQLDADRRTRDEAMMARLSGVQPLPKPETRPAPSPRPPAVRDPVPVPLSGSATVSLPPPNPGLPISRALGLLAPPVAGRLVLRFGDADPSGQPGKGLVIETRSEAPVVAPFDGRVVYAGPFRGYGQILIIDHGEGYHSLLSGLGRIDSGVGQWLLGGEPVGAMLPTSEGGLRLYVELRRNGQPINPLPWLAAGAGKVSG
jgi:septal ring factor EnvC (AmiA/AmiB activator)